jgi:hypothetical protein
MWAEDNLDRKLQQARQGQLECGNYIRAFRNYPEWLGDVEGAKRGAEDNLAEEVLILVEQRKLQQVFIDKSTRDATTGATSGHFGDSSEAI